MSISKRLKGFLQIKKKQLETKDLFNFQIKTFRSHAIVKKNKMYKLYAINERSARFHCVVMFK